MTGSITTSHAVITRAAKVDNTAIPVVYDAAVLMAADRNNRRAWAEHKARLELGIVPSVPTPVVAQVSRSPQQAQLRRFLTGCAVVPLGESDAHEAGRLLGKTRTVDVVDAVVVTVALRK